MCVCASPESQRQSCAFSFRSMFDADRHENARCCRWLMGASGLYVWMMFTALPPPYLTLTLTLTAFLQVREDGHLMLSDLGMATRLRPGERATRVCGTAVYMSPEVLAAAGGYGFMSELWSYGVLLHELCTGLTPFQIKETSGARANEAMAAEIRRLTHGEWKRWLAGWLAGLPIRICSSCPRVRVSALTRARNRPQGGSVGCGGRSEPELSKRVLPLTRRYQGHKGVPIITCLTEPRWRPS